MRDDDRRLAALDAYGMLDTPPDPVIDRLTTLAAGVFEAPFACVSLIDDRRIFLKAAHGLEGGELAREPGMCATAVDTNARRQIEDTERDPVAASHSLVVGEPHVRFYAGTPLRSSEGYAIGTLCVLDTHARRLDDSQMDCLALIADLVMDHFEDRRRALEARVHADALERHSAIAHGLTTDATHGLVCADEKGTVVFVSGLAGRITDLAPGDRLSSVLERVAAEDRDAAREVTQLGSRAQTRQATVRFVADGLEIPVEWRATTEVDGSGRPCSVVATVNPAVETAQFEHVAIEAQKLEGLGVLAGGVAHDFNNILAAIVGNADLALGALDDRPRIERSLHNIDEAAQRAANLCEQLLAYSGGGRFAVSPCDLSALVGDLEDLLEIPLPRKARVDLDLATGLPAIECDPTQIRQVVMNVLTNASEALEGERGTISVSTGDRVLAAAELATMVLGDGLAPGRYVWLDITDDGKGIEPQSLPLLFDPFYSTKFSGHGLGLAAVLGIMRSHRGAIAVQSEAGSGTTVRLVFPASTRHPVPSGGGSAARPDTPGVGCVLVVDDEAAVLDVVAATLGGAGYRTVTAGDGGGARRLVDEHRGEIVAAVIDMMLPDVDGAELVSHIQEVDPSIRVILTSGYNEQEATRRITSDGLAGFLKKPYRPSDLLASLSAVLADPVPADASSAAASPEARASI